jgi:hypothetical protein
MRIFGIYSITSIMAGLFALAVGVSASFADVLPFSLTESQDYLIIATNRVEGNTDVATSNFELGANKAPVPATDNFLDGGGSGGPTLEGAVPALPVSGIAPVPQGPDYSGNIAITDPDGELSLSNVGVYADPTVGIRMAGGSSLNHASNSYFNDPGMYPNTFNIATQTGNSVGSGAAGTSIAPPTSAGMTYGFGHSSLLAELATARTHIDGMASTGTINVSGSGGVISADFTYTASDGLNVVDIITGGNDFEIKEANFVIQGVTGSVVIFRLSGNDNMKINGANILLGDGGILPNQVLFYTSQDENDTHFAFSNTIINGVSFWSLGAEGGSISVSNAQGTTQFIADIVEMDNVRLGGSRFAEPVPEPATFSLLALAGAAMLKRAR